MDPEVVSSATLTAEAMNQLALTGWMFGKRTGWVATIIAALACALSIRGVAVAMM